MALEREMATYRERLSEWSDHEGEFVLIHKDHVVGTFTNYVDAIEAGYGRFLLDPFLVKQIELVEQATVVTRLIGPTTPVFRTHGALHDSDERQRPPGDGARFRESR